MNIPWRRKPRGESRRRHRYGSRFARDPPDATARYAAWANALPANRLALERFREVTLVQPTWFYHKDVWRRAGGFDGATCDDLRFFLRHCARGGLLRRVDESLVTYFRRADLPLMNRGAAAAATWIVRGVATTRRPRRG